MALRTVARFILRGAANDSTSPAHDRGHAGSQSRAAHATGISAICIAVRPPLPQITRPVGPSRDPCLPALLDQGQTARAQLSVLAGTDPVLLMEVDPASAHEFLFNW